jgi:uroporphyrinogen III methyltransferase/synthase
LKKGIVYLVGAGPGDPGLLTVRGLELLRRAEVVIYDRLVNPTLLEYCPQSCERIFVGKRVGSHRASQDDINRLLVERAGRGHTVIRLKGGDPFVFGRGGEEALALLDAGISFEVVPGVSAAVAVPAYAGIPLTHRGVASSFAVVTGHEARKPQAAVDWSKLATAVDTLVVLMGLANLPLIVDRLIAHGCPMDTPVSVISRGTGDDQDDICGTLADIIEKSAHVKPPAIIVVGAVVSLADKLRWFLPVDCNKNRNECDGAIRPAGT